jgi:hypothetical protein
MRPSLALDMISLSSGNRLGSSLTPLQRDGPSTDGNSNQARKINLLSPLDQINAISESGHSKGNIDANLKSGSSFAKKFDKLILVLMVFQLQ